MLSEWLPDVSVCYNQFVWCSFSDEGVYLFQDYTPVPMALEDKSEHDPKQPLYYIMSDVVAVMKHWW